MLNRKSCLALLSVVVAGSGVLLSSPVIAAEQWVRVKTDKFSNAWYVDKNSIQPQGKERLFWLYVVNTQPVNVDNEMIQSFGAYLAINCQSKRIRPRYMRLMDQHNQPLREYDLSASGSRKMIPTQINAGAIAATNYVCALR
jgi:hypothetical protein